MKPYLSIIMPCYNCTQTLENSVASIYDQDLSVSFEIVMVDDGSSDATRNLMALLAERYPEIRCFFHDSNQGGGAARNTAVKNSRGDIVFCLDSDDILPIKMLPRLLRTMKQHAADGVVFERSIFFRESLREPDPISKDGTATESSHSRRVIVLADLFESGRGFLTQVNFLYSKEAFYRSGGYPTHHGFDTQGYGFRFLGANNKAVICPGSYYFHRQAYKKKSYFERVYENGELSRNIYLIIEEIIYLLSNDIIEEILVYDIFEHNRLGVDNLKSFLDIKYTEKDIFNHCPAASMSDYYQNHRNDLGRPEKFICAIYEFNLGLYDQARSHFQELSNNLESSILSYNIARCSAALSGAMGSEIEIRALEDVSNINSRRRRINLDPNLLIRGAVYFKKRIIKILNQLMITK